MEIWKDIVSWLSEVGPGVVKIILSGFFALLLIRLLLRPRLFFYPKRDNPLQRAEQQKRAQTLAGVVRGTGNLIVWVVVILLIIQQLGINLGPFLASAGIAGIAVGLGAQSLVKDIISGFFILMENHFNIGDVIQIGTVSGRVEEVNLRTTILRDLEGAVHIIPNGEIKLVTNRTREWAQVVLDTAIAFDEDIDRAMKVIKEVGREMLSNRQIKSAILAPPKILGVNEVSKTQIIIRSLIKTKPEKKWAVERVIRKKIKQAFDSEGIRTNA